MLTVKTNWIWSIFYLCFYTHTAVFPALTLVWHNTVPFPCHQVSKWASLILKVVSAEGWQPSFSDRSVLKRRQQPNVLPSSSAYSYSQSHSYSYCLSLAVSHLWWHFTAGMMERRGEGGWENLGAMCVCLKKSASWATSRVKIMMFLHLSMITIKLSPFMCLLVYMLVWLWGLCEDVVTMVDQCKRDHIVPVKILK